MINFMNAESVYIGTDMKQFNALRDWLDMEHIKYKYKVKNHMTQWTGRGTVRSYTGSVGNPTETMYEYEILVHKKDADRVKLHDKTSM